jgi:putative FmdB family regulatory protein
MPTYSYFCYKCNDDFEIFSYIKDYTDNPDCSFCGKKTTYRLYDKDVLTQSCSVRKSDSELKTLGDLAMRNTERMSQDEKIALHKKHNDYKENKVETKPLPKGMSYKKKPPKPKWPGT